MAKVEEYQQMMAWLTRPKSKFQEPRIMDQAALVDELEPGELKDELEGNFDPKQETYEEYLQRINLQRPFNMAEGGPLVGTPTKDVTQFDRRIYKTPEGERVSEKSTTLFFNGKWLNVPTIHNGRAFTDDQLRNMLKYGKIQATSEHTSRMEAEEAAAARSSMMKSHTRGFGHGGRIGFKRGKLAVQLTPQMVIDIAEKNPDFTATDIFNKLQKDKTKNYVTSRGTPINRAVINKTLSDVFDLQAAEKAKIPKGYISAQEFFNTKGMPISKHNYMTIKNRNPSLLTDTIGKNAVFVKRGEGGQGAFYYKKPTKEDLKLYQRIASRKGQLRPNTINLMLEFDKKFNKLYEKGELPTLKKIQQFFPDVTPSTAGNVTARLSQWYNGADFINPELKNLNRNKSLAKNIQKASSTGLYGNFYADQAYKVALDTIDEKIGRQVGSFKAFKDNIKTALKEAGLPIYSKNSPFGFNLNEIAGVTGAARTKTAQFSDFVDIAEGRFNQKQLARFQREFAKVREQLDKLDLPNNPKNKAKAQSLIDNFKDTITYYEKATGSELPKIGLGTADQYYSAEKLAEIGKERFVGETGKKKFRKIPGTNLLKASKDAGYTVIVPENYRTVGQIMETGTRDVLKKNVQNTLDGMKKFFNEYDEKKMFQKLKNASPETLRRMMKVIPKFVSLEDDIKRYASANNIMSDATYVDDVEENWFKRNPKTTAAAGAASSLAIPAVRKAAGTAFNLGTGPMGAFWLTKAFEPEGGYDLRKPEDRITFEAEAALAPTLVKGAQSVTEKIKNPLLRKGLEYASGIRLPGVNPANMLRAARVASPIGLLSLAAEGIYHAGKKEMAKRAQMSPEELEEYMLERQSRGWSRMKKAGGGIAGIRRPHAIPPESGPTPQGLPSMLNRVRRI